MLCEELELVGKKDLRRERERDEFKRQEFQARLNTKSANQLVYVDEAGIDNRDDYPYGYCGIGQRFHAVVFCGGIIAPQINLLKSGKRTVRVSWIAALKQGNIFAPLTNTYSCNRDLFEMWLEQCLFPKLQPGDVIIIGNTSFHHSQFIDDIVAAAGLNCGIFLLTLHAVVFGAGVFGIEFLPRKNSRLKPDRAVVVCPKKLDETTLG